MYKTNDIVPSFYVCIVTHPLLGWIKARQGQEEFSREDTSDSVRHSHQVLVELTQPGESLKTETKYYSFKEKLDAALDEHPSDCKAITLEQNSSDPSKPYYLLRGEGNLVTTAVETTSAPPVQLCEDGHEMACWLSNNLPSDYIAIANKLSIETPVVCGELYSTIFEILCHVCQFKAILLAFLAFFIGPEPYCNIHNCSYFVT